MRVRTHSPLVGALIGGLAAFSLVAAGCGNDTDEAAGDDVVQESDFVFESVTAPGQGAFTAPVDVAPDTGPVFQGFAGARQGGGCDKEMLKDELDQRPEAKAAYAEVLGMSQDDVDGYIDTLEPQVLGEDTKFTNHGLNDQGKPFPVASNLEAGTAVLVDKDDSGKSGGPRPVTRCRCGNPLLPAPEIGAKRPEWVTTTTGDPTTSSSSTSSSSTSSSTTTSSSSTSSSTSTSSTTSSIPEDETTTSGDTDGGGDSGDGTATDGPATATDTGGGVVDGASDQGTAPNGDSPATDDQVTIANG